MRNLLRVGLAAALLVLLSQPARAGESDYLGAIVVSGSSLNNATTAAPFVIPPGAKITLYTTASGIQCLTDKTSVATSGASTGAFIPSSSLFPTSVSGTPSILISGTKSAVMACIGTGTIHVWLRTGTE